MQRHPVGYRYARSRRAGRRRGDGGFVRTLRSGARPRGPRGTSRSETRAAQPLRPRRPRRGAAPAPRGREGALTMCGIIGYVGRREAAPILVEGLHRLEYRGYDSAGVAVESGVGVMVAKLAGRVGAWGTLLQAAPLHGTSGIAHTRWATHGAPTTGNAHPHTDCSGTVALVHNGIIENADALRAMLERAGHRFTTETDTEALAHLIEDAAGETLEARVIAALALVEGTYGLAVMWAAEPGKIVVARQGSPVLLGIGDDELFVASDASAVLEHTRSVVYLDDGDIAVLTPAGYSVLDRESHVQVRAVDDIAWDVTQLELAGHAHFMLKEIMEQPETVRATLRGRLLPEAGSARLNGLNLAPEDARALQRIVIVACGTSWHAGLVGRDLIEELAGIPVQVEYASEYRYRRPLVAPGGGTLTLAISQSGETADTLEALRAARAAGWRVLGLVNGVGGTIARECGGGDEARADRAHRRGNARGVRRAARRRVCESPLEHAGSEGARRTAHRRDHRRERRLRGPRRAPAARAGDRTAALSRADDDSPAAARLPHRRAARLRRGSAPQPRQERHRG